MLRRLRFRSGVGFFASGRARFDAIFPQFLEPIAADAQQRTLVCRGGIRPRPDQVSVASPFEIKTVKMKVFQILTDDAQVTRIIYATAGVAHGLVMPVTLRALGNLAVTAGDELQHAALNCFRRAPGPSQYTKHRQFIVAIEAKIGHRDPSRLGRPFGGGKAQVVATFWTGAGAVFIYHRLASGPLLIHIAGDCQESRGAFARRHAAR